MTNKIFAEGIKIKREDYNLYRKYLINSSDIKTLNLSPNEELLNLNVTFEDGTTGELIVYTGDESVMATYYVTNDEKKIDLYEECDEDLFTNYSIETDNAEYIMSLIIE